MKREGVTFPAGLIPRKIQAHGKPVDAFRIALEARVNELRGSAGIRDTFIQEMRRFLPANLARQTIEAPPFWDYLVETVRAESATVLQALE